MQYFPLNSIQFLPPLENGNRYEILLHDTSGFRLIGTTPDDGYLVAQAYETATGTTLAFIDQNDPSMDVRQRAEITGCGDRKR